MQKKKILSFNNNSNMINKFNWSRIYIKVNNNISTSQAAIISKETTVSLTTV